MVVLMKRPTLYICIAEQEPEDNLTEYLAAKGFGVRRIGESGQAVDEIITRVSDLVLLDSHLAPAGGFEVCRAVRSLYRQEYNGFDRSLDVYISRIRQQLGDSAENPTYLKTVRGVGYLFAAENPAT